MILTYRRGKEPAPSDDMAPVSCSACLLRADGFAAAKFAYDNTLAEHDTGAYASALAALRASCPAYVAEDCWHHAVADATAFALERRARAEAFGWTKRELFGLRPVPKRPAANYSRLSRLDDLGLLWLLRGWPVVTLTATEAAYRCPSGAILTYRRKTTSISLSDAQGVAA